MLALLSASVDGVLKLWTFKSADVLENVFATPPSAEVCVCAPTLLAVQHCSAPARCPEPVCVCGADDASVHAACAS
jgi:hypothetical protein